MRRKQVERYSRFGVPVDLVCGREQAAEYLSLIVKHGVHMPVFNKLASADA